MGRDNAPAPPVGGQIHPPKTERKWKKEHLNRLTLLSFKFYNNKRIRKISVGSNTKNYHIPTLKHQ